MLNNNFYLELNIECLEEDEGLPQEGDGMRA